MNTAFTDMQDLVRGFACAMNLISPEVQNHHQQVAYLSYHLALQMKLSDRYKEMAVYGALLHDVGAVMAGNLSLMELEKKPRLLAKRGFELLRQLPKTQNLADIILHCQGSTRAPILSFSLKDSVFVPQIIHLADMVSLMIDPTTPILNQISRIENIVSEDKEQICSEVISAFHDLCRLDYVWLDLLARPNAFLDFFTKPHPLSLEETASLAEFMSIIIDFRSPFTAMHSAGVSATAVELSRCIGMSEAEQIKMRIAGNLHDLGKMKTPTEILEKPGKLTDEEFNIIKEHAYYTTLFLRDIHGFEDIYQWAGYHHEKLNGKGYPFRLTADQIPFGARLMAVADIFSAIAEDRPYRKRMEKDQVIRIMQENVTQGALSPSLVEALLDNYDTIDAKRDEQSHLRGRRYYESLTQNSEIDIQ